MATTRTYDDALDCLNSLQTQFKTLEQRRAAGIKPGSTHYENTLSALERIGYTQRDLARLNIVHVAGTKGKGTACAYVNSILSFYQRSRGLPRKTGLFTSPHLVSVRERIRIDSAPISAALFAQYFFEVWDRLELGTATQGLEAGDKPPYFRFLTLMSFHVFLSEGVDAAVYEVGVGGEFDSTNVIAHPAATGIATLGIDHVYALGHTIEEIAWHKLGILKHGSPAFSVEQVPAAMGVIAQRAKEKDVDVQMVPIDPRLASVRIEPAADFQRRNASLAIALTGAVMQRLDPEFALPADAPLPQEFVDGLEQVVWRGRFETKDEGKIRWFIDGAHTVDSLAVAAQWFSGASAERAGTRVLVFNQQGRDEAVALLEGLWRGVRAQGAARFDHVVFCTNVTYAAGNYKRDFVSAGNDPAAIEGMTVQRAFAARWAEMDPEATVVLRDSIEGAVGYVRGLAEEGEGDVQALITGSLHLVGGALEVLEGGDAL